jgi:hypothetical protein
VLDEDVVYSSDYFPIAFDIKANSERKIGANELLTILKRLTGRV